MGPPEGKILVIDTVSQKRLQAIKKSWNLMKILKKSALGSYRSHPGFLGLGEPYPTPPHDLKSVS